MRHVSDVRLTKRMGFSIAFDWIAVRYSLERTSKPLLASASNDSRVRVVSDAASSSSSATRRFVSSRSESVFRERAASSAASRSAALSSASDVSYEDMSVLERLSSVVVMIAGAWAGTETAAAVENPGRPTARPKGPTPDGGYANAMVDRLKSDRQ